MNSLAVDLVELSRDCELVEPSAFVIRGVKTVIEGGGAPLEIALSESIYRHQYCRPSPGGGLMSFAARNDLLADLARANRGRGTMEPGWRFVRRERDGRVVVEKHGVHFWAADQHVTTRSGPATACQPGENVLVFVPADVTELNPGFYFFSGDATDPSDASNGATARFYWHVTAAGAAVFVEQLSTLLNRAKIPFRAKVLCAPSHFLRADAAVLYLNRDLVTKAVPHLRAVYTEIRPFLRESVPMFTLRLAAGLGAADDPGDQTSFGQHRSTIAARGLIRSYVDRPPTADERLASIARAYEEAGLCPTRTHLAGTNAKPYPRFATRQWLKELSA